MHMNGICTRIFQCRENCRFHQKAQLWPRRETLRLYFQRPWTMFARISGIVPTLPKPSGFFLSKDTEAPSGLFGTPWLMTSERKFFIGV